MSAEAWVGILGVAVGLLSACVAALIGFLFKLSLKVNTLEQQRISLMREISDFKQGIVELREYLFSRGRKKNQSKPDSDEAGEQPQENGW